MKFCMGGIVVHLYVSLKLRDTNVGIRPCELENNLFKFFVTILILHVL
jgi:hypothetical protein